MFKRRKERDRREKREERERVMEREKSNGRVGFVGKSEGEYAPLISFHSDP